MRSGDFVTMQDGRKVFVRRKIGEGVWKGLLVQDSDRAPFEYVNDHSGLPIQVLVNEADEGTGWTFLYKSDR